MNYKLDLSQYFKHFLKNTLYIDFFNYITFIDSLENLFRTKNELDHLLANSNQESFCLWSEYFLRLKLGVGFEDREQLEWIASHGIRSDLIQPPVVIIVGSCNATAQDTVRKYQNMIVSLFSSFHGTIIGGGTKSGASGIVGDIQALYHNQIVSVGYLPASTDPGIIDERYLFLVRTSGGDFSPLEPLQYWIDIIGAGVSPKDIRMIGINGGEISCLEYQLAYSFGVTVDFVNKKMER